MQAQNEGVVGHEIQPGARVWLYLDRVKEGYAKKLAHLWHGPFRVRELVGDYAVRLRLRGTIPNRAHFQAQARQRVPRSTEQRAESGWNRLS